MRPKIASLLRTVEQLGEATGVATPKDEIWLARLLAEHLSDELAPHVLVLLCHRNMHARRVALQAIRRASFWSNRVLADAVVERLDDPESWVRYDAARALGTRGEGSPEIIEALRHLAGDASPRDTRDLDDDAQQARVAAARALLDLGALPE